MKCAGKKTKPNKANDGMAIGNVEQGNTGVNPFHFHTLIRHAAWHFCLPSNCCHHVSVSCSRYLQFGMGTLTVKAQGISRSN